jgi:hypothetical protein
MESVRFCFSLWKGMVLVSLIRQAGGSFTWNRYHMSRLRRQDTIFEVLERAVFGVVMGVIHLRLRMVKVAEEKYGFWEVGSCIITRIDHIHTCGHVTTLSLPLTT